MFHFPHILKVSIFFKLQKVAVPVVALVLCSNRNSKPTFTTTSLITDFRFWCRSS